MTKPRVFHYIDDASASRATGSDQHVQYTYDFKYSSHEIDSMDLFEDELVLIAYPIGIMQHIDSILRHFGLNDNSYYFFHQVKDLVALPEKHINDKGEGKIDFQAFFRNVPYSFMSINNTATVLIGLHPLKNKNAEGLRDYNLIGYIHANQFEYTPEGKQLNCYYYNMLRIADKPVEGENIYRRKRLFTLFFGVLNKLAALNDVDVAYASMGRENVAINDALHKCAEYAGVHYERLHYKIFGQINRVWESGDASKELVDITHDQELLDKYYDLYVRERGKSLFFQPETRKEFHNWVGSVSSYSTSSGIFATMNGNEIKSAVFAINWSDYFLMLILNPKGFFRVVSRLKLVERVLFPVMAIGEPDDVRQLYKGLAYKFRREQGCKVTLIPSYVGDPYYKVKKGLLDDNFYYFVITRDKEGLQRYKELSKDEDGNIHPFVGMPIT